MWMGSQTPSFFKEPCSCSSFLLPSTAILAGVSSPTTATSSPYCRVGV